MKESKAGKQIIQQISKDNQTNINKFKKTRTRFNLKTKCN